jgi:hypothetical protein
VTVLFVNDRAVRPHRFRSIVFAIRDDGKIDPDGIELNGFGTKGVFEMVFEQGKQELPAAKTGTNPVN